MQHIIWFSQIAIGHRHITFSYLGLWGVNCFFVLSGFLLGEPYVRCLIDAVSLPSIRKFYVRRFLRIYPLYLIAVIVSILSEKFIGEHLNPSDIFLHVFMCQGLSLSTVTSLNGPLWTMGIDAAFYLFLPLIAQMLTTILKKKSRENRILLVVIFLLVCCLGCLAYRFTAYSMHPQAYTDFSAGAFYVRNALGFTFSFCIGVILALFQFLHKPSNKRWTGSMGGLGVFVAIVAFADRVAVVNGSQAHKLLTFTFIDPIAALSVACILFWGLQQSSDALATRIAALRVTALIASIAYGLYLFHWPIIDMVDHFFIYHQYGIVDLLLLSVASLFLTVPVAYGMHIFVEKPLLRLKDREH
jgi:peptidoglycan/LPS O-acetylase OafA/YrhL